MERRGQLDAARRPRARQSILVELVLLAAFSFLSQAGCAQTTPQADRISRIQTLFEEGRWAEVAAEAQPVFAHSADGAYYYGSAEAQLGQWDEARRAFVAGLRMAPDDARFSVELAGVAFKQKRYQEAQGWLRRGLRLVPGDPYVTDFLATTYFLQNNLEAALKYWNRTGKPRIAQVRVEPELRVKPELLDRAFTFAPGSVLRAVDYRTTEARAGGLGIFNSYSLRLGAEDDGSFDAIFSAQERNGWGNKWQGLLATFRGVFYQTIYPEYWNIGGSAMNVTSLVRWDAQKRRVLASVSAPLRGNPKYRTTASVDLRNENWGLRALRQGSPQGALNLRRESLRAAITSFEGDRWGWSTGAEFSHRNYRNVFPGVALPGDVLLAGYQLKVLGQLHYGLWRIPERRFDSEAAISSETATIWASPAHSFEKLQAALAMHWFPQAIGDDYEMRAKIGAGKTLGTAPFDELFMLGLERDNDLWMRAHPGTHDGQKGSAPLGRDYFLSNWEMDKSVYSNGLFGFKVGPFVDVGRVIHALPGLGPRQVLIDTGAQAKVRVLGVGITFIYGKDLRSGRNTYYLTTTR